MALFRCASGTSGGGATITVTYSADFYGETITCSNGVKTYSKVAPNTGTVDFSVDEEGTWTISCTIGANPPYTDTVEVDLSYSANLEAIPDGSTVTPTDSVSKWLECAGITDKAYTTLAQVIGDSETFNALLGDSNACAYMKRSTTFAVAVGQVPTMTDDTHPSGVCSYAGMEQTSDYPPYKSFNGGATSSDGCLPDRNNTASTLTYLQYEFDTAKVVRRVVFYSRPTTSTLNGTTLYVQGSNDGFVSDVHDLSSAIVIPSFTNTNDGVKFEYSFENNDAYKYVRISNKALTQWRYTDLSIQRVQFYSDIDLTTSQYAMNLLGQYDTACDALLSDSTWASAIAQSAFFESVVTPLVPKMTSNTAPSGEVFGSNIASATPKYYAFDRDTSTAVNNDSGIQIELGYKFDSATKVYFASVTNRTNATPYAIKDFTIKGSADGTTYTDLGSGTATNTSGATTRVVLSDNTNCLYFKMANTTAYDSSYVRVAEVQFYGRTPSSEKIHGGNPTYDSFYRIVDGNNVPVTDPSLLDAGTYTIYSNGLAKDPDNLSNDYGKTVRICPNTKEIVVRPDNALYWYGVMGNSCEELSSANGWSRSGSSFVSPTFDNTKVTIAGASSTYCGIATKYSVRSAKAYAIVTTTTSASENRFMGANISKVLVADTSFPYRTMLTSIETNAKENLTMNASADLYAGVISLGNYSVAVSAFVLE